MSDPYRPLWWHPWLEPLAPLPRPPEAPEVTEAQAREAPQSAARPLADDASPEEQRRFSSQGRQ